MPPPDQWPEIASRIASLLSQKFTEIRQEIPVDEILGAAKCSLPTDYELNLDEYEVSDIPNEAFFELANQINGVHRRRIKETIEGLGAIELEYSSDKSIVFLEEDVASIRMKVEGSVVRINKDMAEKIVFLGRLP
jgi:hypothetical protein